MIPLRFSFLLCSAVVAFGSIVSAFDREQEHAGRLVGLCRSDISKTAKVEQGQQAGASTDIIISSNNAPSHFTQDASDAATLKSGNVLVVWEDNRGGAEKLYGQVMTGSGALIDTNILLAGAEDGSTITDPVVLPDTTGHFWLMYRNQTYGRIICQRFTDALATVGAELLINDTSLGAYAGPFDAATYPNGALVVVWENYAAGNTIEMRMFDASGSSILGPSTANSDASVVSRWTPSVAVDPQSGFLVAWEDYRFGNADVYARLFTGAGTAVGPDFGIVPPVVADSQQYTPEVAFSSRDKYAIGWIDSRSAQEVYLQVYDATSGLIGSNVQISISNPSALNWNLHFSVASSGDLLAVWDATVSESSILMQRFATAFAPVGTPGSANSNATGQRWNPGASTITGGNYAVCWSEYQNYNSDIMFQLFNASGLPQLTELVLNDDTRGAPKTDPVIMASSDWYNIIAYASTGTDQGDILVRSISNAGNIPGANLTANEDGAGALQSEPALAVSSTTGLVVWSDSRDVLGIPGQRIYGRLCTYYGSFTTSEFMVSDSGQTGIKSSPKAAMAASGKGLVAWVDLRNGTPQIWGRWLTSGGALDGAELQVSQGGTDSSCSDAYVGTDVSGRFYAVWVDRRTTPVIRCHWYNADGTSGGYTTFTPAGALIDELSAAVNDSGEVTVAYTGNVGGRKLFLAAFNRASAQVLAPTRLDDNNSALPSEPAISYSESTNQYAVCWVDRRSGLRSIEYQILDANRLVSGSNLPVSSTAPEFMINPSVTLNDGRAWFVWADPRSNGQNIWSTGVIYQPTGIDNKPPTVPHAFNLGQNYPNPFNPSTEIGFSLVKRGRAVLEVFNLLGERVSVLSDGVFGAGEHHVTWDGRSWSGHVVSSGVYFYRLTTPEGSITRKMTLIK